ncbi:MAG: hypothetical protein HQL78_10900 [Magnetococcales bacterium]|nr:hypothetical protein [Magnetococcales bacterium]MBF0420658.1 hypothetical protein [Magnetococcales bacterium]
MTTITQEDPRILEALQAAVCEELDRKKRLGHYAVFWQDGKAVAIGEDAPQSATPAASGDDHQSW